MEGNIILLFPVIWPLLGALIGYLIGRKNKTFRDFLVASVTIVEFGTLLYLGINVYNGMEYTFFEPNFCARGLSFSLDGFRAVYTLIAAFMWMMATLFAKQYFAHYRNRNRFYFFWLVTLSATVGVFLSADLFTTFIFFEVMSLTSYVWVAQEENEAALKAAGTYLAVAIIGGMVMLMGLFLLNHAVGTLEMAKLREACETLEDKSILYVAGGCMLFGFGAKAGMFPLHIWLPKAHPVAPAPASALLSGILTKTGVFGILVISGQIFLYDKSWGMVVLLLGVITMLGGAVLAVFSVNLKRTLACSSMSQIGFILVGIGMMGLLGEHNSLAVRGTMLHMVNHSLIKLVLFIAAGVVFMNLHELDLNKIRGFGKGKPAFLFAFLMGALGIGGIPLWNGYVSKTLLHESIVEYKDMVVGTSEVMFFNVIEWIFLITGGLTVAYMIKLFVALFIEENEEKELRTMYSGSYMNKTTSFALVGSAVLLPVLGILPNVTMDRIADTMQEFVHGHSPAHQVSYYSVGNLSGGLISIAIGIIIYFGFIRTCLMRKNEKGKKVYVNCWPSWMDIEDSVYRPIIMQLLMFVLAFILRLFDKLLDGIIYVVSNTILRPSRKKRPIEVGTRFTYFLGTIMDDIVKFLNRYILKKRPIKTSFVNFFALSHKEVNRTSRLVTRSVSFGLLMFSIGLMMTLIYLLAVL